ncbi:MAG: hypothetical protein AABX93_02970 [Nanoarchaeota archaeon]
MVEIIIDGEVSLLEDFENLHKKTADMPKVAGYKLGPGLTLGNLTEIYERIISSNGKNGNKKKFIWDGQKSGTDIDNPKIANNLMKRLKRFDFDAVILFPLSGPAAQYVWTKSAQEHELEVIVGGEMTHLRFLEGDFKNSKERDYSAILKEMLGRDVSGYIRNTAPEDIYEIAAKMSVTSFVVPGNKPEKIEYYAKLIKKFGVKNPSFYSPGFITQGGEISEAAKAVGKNATLYAIVGRAIYEAQDIRQATLDLANKIQQKNHN